MVDMSEYQVLWGYALPGLGFTQVTLPVDYTLHRHRQFRKIIAGDWNFLNCSIYPA